MVASLTAYGQDGASAQTIIWYRADFPPVTIVDGSNAGLGLFDQVTDPLNVCCPSLYKTLEREAFIAFSIPAMIALANVNITQKELPPNISPI